MCRRRREREKRKIMNVVAFIIEQLYNDGEMNKEKNTSKLEKSYKIVKVHSKYENSIFYRSNIRFLIY